MWSSPDTVRSGSSGLPSTVISSATAIGRRGCSCPAMRSSRAPIDLDPEQNPSHSTDPRRRPGSVSEPGSASTSVAGPAILNSKSPTPDSSIRWSSDDGHERPVEPERRPDPLRVGDRAGETRLDALGAVQDPLDVHRDRQGVGLVRQPDRDRLVGGLGGQDRRQRHHHRRRSRNDSAEESASPGMHHDQLPLRGPPCRPTAAAVSPSARSSAASPTAGRPAPARTSCRGTPRSTCRRR